jgi:hypothetical protein
VVVREKTNARYLSPEDLGETVDFVTIDVSFISLTKILPALPGLLAGDGEGVALVKPQFEAGREQVGKKGVVRNPDIHQSVLAKILQALPEWGLKPYGLTFSPLRGPEGNIEYLLWFGRKAANEAPGEAPGDTVSAASGEAPGDTASAASGEAPGDTASAASGEAPGKAASTAPPFPIENLVKEAFALLKGESK